MKVYVVLRESFDLQGGDDDGGPIFLGVYATREKAEEIAEELQGDQPDVEPEDYSVEELELEE
jgi:hypothetical protein